jgi:hypothetical protein
MDAARNEAGRSSGLCTVSHLVRGGSDLYALSFSGLMPMLEVLAAINLRWGERRFEYQTVPFLGESGCNNSKSLELT